jgi:hypothetical protein
MCIKISTTTSFYGYGADRSEYMAYPFSIITIRDWHCDVLSELLPLHRNEAHRRKVSYREFIQPIGGSAVKENLQINNNNVSLI